MNRKAFARAVEVTKRSVQLFASIEDEMNAGCCGGYERWLNRENFPDALGGENFLWSTRAHDASAIHQDNLIGETRGQIQIVNYADCDNVRRVSKRAHLLHKIDLVANVEKRQRLVDYVRTLQLELVTVEGDRDLYLVAD